jgi:hypothetical protein
VAGVALVFALPENQRKGDPGPEGDRLFYSTTWERIASELRRDVHFVSVGGIGGFADTCELYRQLKIPVCIMADLDLLRELDPFERIMKSLASNAEAKAALAKCRSARRGHGLLLVPAGELEDWVPDLAAGGPSKKKKAEWANYPTNKIREAPVRTNDVWLFVRRMAEFQRDTINRLSGFAL